MFDENKSNSFESATVDHSDPVESLSEFKSSWHDIWNHLTTYTKTSKDLLKLESNEAMSQLWSGLFRLFIVLSALVVSTVFFLKGISLGINELTKTDWAGYLSAGGVFLLGTFIAIKLMGRQRE